MSNPNWLSKVLVLICFAACQKESKNTIFLVQGKEINLHFPSESTRAYGISFVEIAGNEYFTYQNADNESLDLFDIYSEKKIFSIPLHNLPGDEDNFYSFYVHNLDSIFLFKIETRIIFLIDRFGKILTTYTIVDSVNGTQDYTIQTLQQMPLQYANGKLYVMNARNDLSVTNEDARKIYFSSSPETVINVSQNGKLERNQFVTWPSNYLHYSYHDFWPSRCIDSRGRLIYSYSANDSLYVYTDTGLQTKYRVKSKYLSRTAPFLEDKFGDHLYVKKYWIEEGVYDKILFDRHRNYIYRIVKHAIPYKKNKFELNTIKDKPWSVIILDEKLNFLSEIKFDPKIYSPDFFIPLKDGILISKTKTSSTINIAAQLFTFQAL